MPMRASDVRGCLTNSTIETDGSVEGRETKRVNGMIS